MRRSIPFVFIVMAMLRSPCGWAAIVTTTADSGPGSLRQAIASASPGETLTFAVSGLITLTSGELLITTNLTITGPGASQLTVQRSSTAGTPDFRIFDIKSRGIVTISGLTVSNGRSDFGGGVLNRAGLVEDTAPEVRPAIAHSQTGDGDDSAGLDVEDAKVRRPGSGAPLHSQLTRPRTCDGQVGSDQQLTAGQSNEATDGEGQGLAGAGAGNGLAQ